MIDTIIHSSVQLASLLFVSNASNPFKELETNNDDEGCIENFIIAYIFSH